ncbi:DUF1995 family protein [Synechocystis sp. LKSZ1]|uniref:DUF1995 family protein n=1 Tax=Synechocystis sp. LKSZ1 TaxID=3144951 RepID=UPI00336C2987
MTVPPSLEVAIREAMTATERALAAGCQRIQIELVIPEIALQAQSLALQFTSLFEDYGLGLRVLFPDTGAAALARRDWGETWFQVSDLGSRYTPVDRKIAETDQVFLVVSPSAVEVQIVEHLCTLAGDRPVILLIPQLEDVSIVGIGYAARQLRERFLSTLVSSYYFRPLEGAVVLRSFPSPWQVYLEQEEDYQLIAEEPQKPAGEALEILIQQALNPQESNASPTASSIKKPGLFASMGRFLRALNQ